MLDLKTDKLYDSEKEDEGKTFHVLQVLLMNEDLWDRLRGLGSETLKGCEWVELWKFGHVSLLSIKNSMKDCINMVPSGRCLHKSSCYMGFQLPLERFLASQVSTTRNDYPTQLYSTYYFQLSRFSTSGVEVFDSLPPKNSALRTTFTKSTFTAVCYTQSYIN